MISVSSGSSSVRDVVVIANELVPEASVEQVHDGVFHAANVDVDGHAAENGGVKRCTFVFGIKVSQKVPA